MISSSGTNHRANKIIGRTWNSLQSRCGTMIISIIAILLLARGALSSLPVYGSISMIDDDTISINLHVNKSGVDDDSNELIEKLKAVNAKLRIHLDLGERIIEINNGAEQDCFEIDDINKILRRMTSLMQEHGKKKTHQDSIYYEELQRSIIPQRYQSSMNLDREFEYYIPPKILSNIELALERERLNLKSELLFEYIKSIQNSLSLIRLLDVKWRQLHDDFDNSFRRKLLTLKKQAEFFLENLIEEKQQQHAKKSKNSKNIFSRDKNKNDVSSDEDIQKDIKKAMTLNEKDIKNFRKSDKTEIDKNKTHKINKNITNDKLAPKIETRIMNHPQLLKNISSHDFENKNSTAIKINLSNQKFITNKSIEVEADLVNRKISTTKKFISIPRDKSLAIGFEAHGNRSSEAKKIRAILSGKNIMNTLKENQKQDKIHVVLHKSLRKNVIDKPKTPSRRTLQILVPSDENKNKKQKSHRVLRKKIKSNSREEVKVRMDSISAMDEILEAVDEVLPTENPMEISPKGLKRTIPSMS